MMALFSVVLPLLALISLLRKRTTDTNKLIWVLIILLLPILGSLLYFFIERPKLIAAQIRNGGDRYIER